MRVTWRGGVEVQKGDCSLCQREGVKVRRIDLKWGEAPVVRWLCLLCIRAVYKQFRGYK